MRSVVLLSNFYKPLCPVRPWYWWVLWGGLSLLGGILACGDGPEQKGGSPIADGSRLYVTRTGGFNVYDVGDEHRFLHGIEVDGTGYYRGLCADVNRAKLYLSSLKGEQLVCIDLFSERVDWRLQLGGGVDNPALVPGGQFIYMPREKAGDWLVVDLWQKKIIKSIKIPGRPHNTWPSRDGRHMYLSARENPILYITDTSTHQVVGQVGPFKSGRADGSGGIRPFTVSAAGLVYVNTDDLLGFEVGDLKSGKRLYRVEVEGFEPLRSNHDTFSHGIRIRPDQQELWVSNDQGKYVHVFDLQGARPKQVADIALSRENGWITFGLDGRYAYPSSGDVIDVHSKEIVAQIEPSERLLEIKFSGGRPIKASKR